jgi:hypothetical protein
VSFSKVDTLVNNCGLQMLQSMDKVMLWGLPYGRVAGADILESVCLKFIASGLQK